MKTDKLTSSYLTLRDKLHRSAMAFLKNDEDAKDAMQDTFIKLWRSGYVETEPEARNKLFAALRNICIDKLRKPRTEGIDSIVKGGPVVLPVEFEDMGRYESLLTDGLSNIQRQIYSLSIHKGMDYTEIADYLKMSVDAVRMNMSRARKRIRYNYKNLDK